VRWRSPSLRRVLLTIARVVGLGAIVVVALTVAVLLHLRTPAARRCVRTTANEILASTFAGRIEIDELDRIGIDGLGGARITVHDPAGVQVLHVDGLTVRIAGLATARSALLGRGPIVIDGFAIEIGNVDANLDAGADGALRIANAFAPKVAKPPAPPEPPGRGVRLGASVVVGHAWVHGTPPNAVAVDVDLEDLGGRVHLDPVGVEAHLDRLRFSTRALPRKVDPHGILVARFAMTFDAPATKLPDLEVRFEGAIGEMPTRAEAKLIDGRVDAAIDTEDATGNSARALLPETQVHEALSLHASAHGPLSGMDAKVALSLGAATIDVDAIVGIGETTKVDGRIRARHVDPHAIVEAAPPSDLGLDARAKVALTGPDIVGEIAVDTLPGKIGDDPVPPIEIRATCAGKAAEAHIEIEEPSAPTLVTVKLAPRSDGNEGQVVVASVRSSIPDLRRVPRVGAAAGATGQVTVDASGRLTLPEKTFEAKARVSVRNLVKDAKRLGSAEVLASARGSVARPVVDAEVRATNLTAGDFTLTAANARAHVEIDGAVVDIVEPSLDFARLDLPVAARARRVRIEGNALRVEAAEIRGLGESIRADVVKTATEIRARIDAPRIDLKTVGLLAAKPELVRSGTAAVDGEVRLRGPEAKASVKIALADVAAADVEHARATIDASIDGREVSLDLKAAVDDAGEIAVVARQAVLGGPAIEPRSWARARGTIDVRGTADLARVAAILPRGTLPLSELGGTTTLAGRIHRGDHGSLPDARLHVHTERLVVAGASTAANGTVETVTTWRSPDVDVACEAHVDAASGQTGIALRATDAHGLVASLDAKAVFPVSAILESPALAKQSALEAPLSAKLVIPSRRLDQLPSVLGVHGIDGTAALTLDVSGTAVEPAVHLTGNLRGLHTEAMPPALKPDVDMGLDYDGRILSLSTKIRGGGRELVELAGRAEIRARDAIEGKSDLPWKAGAKLRLASLPLEWIQELADRDVRGNISGQITLDDIHEDARLNARIDLDHLAVGQATYERGSITVDATKGTATARARLDQTDGFLDASATTGIVWGAELVPEIDASRTTEAKLLAKGFRARVVQPFVVDVAPTLDGLIEANASVRFAGGSRTPTLEGILAFHDGTILLAALGDELRGVRATAAMSSDGTIRITDVSAKGVQGEITADALVKLAKTRLASATANVKIAEGTPFALAVDGAPVGNIAGTAKIDVVDISGRLSVAVDVPALSVELPQTIKGNVQSLDAKKNVHVGVYRASEPETLAAVAREKPRPPPAPETEPPTPIDVEIKLGRITVNRPNSAEIVLSGRPKLTLDRGARMSGQIQLESGWANLQGKKFTIEKGTVTFTEVTPPNPVVVATAVWAAPTGARIYADFVGPVKTGKVTLRSEPPMSQDDILAVILFGSADGANGGRPQAGAKPDGRMQAANGLGGSLVAEGLTQALDDLAGIKANARVDTSRSNNPRPEVEFQLSPKVSVAFSHVLGTPPITEPDKNLASVGWRVYRNWSLETTVGDRGRALFDAIWQHRY